MTRRFAAVRRVIVLAAAFGVGLVVADRMMSARLLADDAAELMTTRPADAATSPATRPALSADVRAVLDRVTAAYAAMPLDLTGTLEQDFQVAGIGQRDRHAIRATVRSPSTFRHELVDATLIVGDGAQTHVYDPQNKRYVDRPIDAANGRPTIDADAMMILAMQNPAAAVAIAGDAAEALVPAGATNVALLPPTTADGRTFDRVEVRADAIRSEAWIDRATGRIDRTIVDYAQQLAAGGAANVERATVTLRYEQVGPATAPSVADDRFTFDVPKGASLASAATGKPMTAGGAAPAFTLADLDGQQVKLADQRGHVVVLDFWATWCGPCRAAMPHLAAAAKEYADRGVRVFAVNREEDAATIRPFLEKADLTSLRVLLDSDGAVAKAFRVTGIPLTVVIDARGRISKTILGFAPGGEATLRAAIDAALTASADPAGAAAPGSAAPASPGDDAGAQ